MADKSSPDMTSGSACGMARCARPSFRTALSEATAAHDSQRGCDGHCKVSRTRPSQSHLQQRKLDQTAQNAYRLTTPKNLQRPDVCDLESLFPDRPRKSCEKSASGGRERLWDTGTLQSGSDRQFHFDLSPRIVHPALCTRRATVSAQRLSSRGANRMRLMTG